MFVLDTWNVHIRVWVMKRNTFEDRNKFGCNYHKGKKNQMDCYCRLMFNQAEKLNLLTHQFCFKFTGIIIRYGSLTMEDESLFISFRNVFWKVFLFLQNFKETNIHVVTTLDSFSCLLIRVTNIRNKGIIITAYSGRYYKLRPNYICI